MSEKKRQTEYVKAVTIVPKGKLCIKDGDNDEKKDTMVIIQPFPLVNWHCLLGIQGREFHI